MFFYRRIIYKSISIFIKKISIYPYHVQKHEVHFLQGKISGTIKNWKDEIQKYTWLKLACQTVIEGQSENIKLLGVGRRPHVIDIDLLECLSITGFNGPIEACLGVWMVYECYCDICSFLKQFQLKKKKRFFYFILSYFFFDGQIRLLFYHWQLFSVRMNTTFSHILFDIYTFSINYVYVNYVQDLRYHVCVFSEHHSKSFIIFL